MPPLAPHHRGVPLRHPGVPVLNPVGHNENLEESGEEA